MALNLGIFCGVVTDGGGTQASTQAERNGLNNADLATNAATVATNQTYILKYDLGVPWEIQQIRIYASAVNVAYWKVEVSNDDDVYFQKAVASGGTHIYSNLGRPYQYIKITCDTTGRVAISPREYVIEADDTKMKFQTGTSGTIGGTSAIGGLFTTLNRYIIIDTQNPGAEDGFLVAFRGITAILDYQDELRVAIFRDIGDSYRVFDICSSFVAFEYDDLYVLSTPLRFREGDYVGFRIRCNPTNQQGFLRRNVVGRSYERWTTDTDIAWKDTLAKTNFTTVADYEICLNSMTNADLPAFGSAVVPIPDRRVTGSPGESTDPRVWNLAVTGTSPKIDYAPIVSTLSAGISADDTTIPLHSASDFPQGVSGYTYAGRVIIGNEQIDYAYVQDNSLKECTRGVNGTVPSAHSAWDIVKNITPYIELSVDNSNFYTPLDPALPLSLGASIPSASAKTFYLRFNGPVGYPISGTLTRRFVTYWTVS